MVNRGPSAGCQTCRERRVGCDKARPACARCVMRGQACPGYRDAGGVVFKDESRAVFTRQARRAAPKPPTLLPPLRSHPHDVTTAFFFRQCVLPTRQQWPLGNEYFEHILPLYNSARPSSALPVAVSVMALKVATAHHNQEYAQPLVAETELAAIEAVNVALSDPRQRLEDETLLAILYLDFAQQFRRQQTAFHHARPHLQGALALIQHRGPAAFSSGISQSLYIATRGHLLLEALWSDDGSVEQYTLSKLPEISPPHENIAHSIHHILQLVVCLESQILTWQALNLTSSRGTGQVSPYAARAQSLCERLEVLRDKASQGLCSTDAPLPHATFERPNDAPLVQKAFVFGQYICTYLLALKLLYATGDLTRNNTAGPLVAYLAKVPNLLQELVSHLCVSVIPILDRSRFLQHPSDGDLGRAISTETRPELSNGLKDDGLASASHSHLVCITTWVLSILTEGISAAEEFGIATDKIRYLQQVSSSLSAN